MRAYSRAVAPGIPFVSISVSLVALRFLSWAELKVLPGKSSEASAFAGSTFADHRQHSKSKSLRLLPWAHAAPLDTPVAQHRPPRVIDSMPKKKADESSRTSASLWRDCQLEALRSLHHPWTLGLATGRTHRASFKHYVAQDAYFLRAFAKAYAYALIKVEDEEGVRAFHSLIGSVLDELGLHTSYATKWGIDIRKMPPPLGATSEYVDFLLGVASDPASSVAQVLASMAPCMRLYAFLGNELREAFPRWGDSPYAEWIETYSSPDFENASALVETLLDAYSKEADYLDLLSLYRKAMELEYAFFAAQSQGTAEDDRPHHLSLARGDEDRETYPAVMGDAGDPERFRGVQERVALLCVDFDDTLTDGDTTGLLIKTAKAQRDTPSAQAVVEREWARLTKAFLSKWSEVTEQSLAAKNTDGVCTAISGGRIDRKGLEEMLQRLQTVDLDSVSRVSDSKVLSGITREGIHSALAGPLRSSWKVRPGMARCLARALTSPFQTHVVSINWSKDVITRVLSETLDENHSFSPSVGVKPGNGVSTEPDTFPGESNGPLFGGGGGEWPAFVSSNDLMYDKHGVSTGEIEVKVSGSFGKHQRFLDLAESARKAVGGLESSPRSITVYVGDSVTDLLAMLDADVGIVVGNSGTFERLTRAFGVAVLPLASAYEALDDTGESSGEASSRRGRCVYRVSQWAEIEVFLFGGGER